jgi:hypothetical protein
LRRLLIIGASRVTIKRHVHAAARTGIWLGGMPMGKPPMPVLSISRCGGRACLSPQPPSSSWDRTGSSVSRGA